MTKATDMTSGADVSALKDRLTDLERAYWLDNEPLVPDEVYDDLRRKYRDLTDGLERPIGVEGSGRETLPSPMYSLDNVFNVEEYEKWVRSLRKKLNHQEIEFIVEYKHDGLSLTLYYEKGELVKAYSRGDGKEGEPITDRLPNWLKEYKPPTDIPLEIRGEMFVKLSNFEKINEERGDKPYAHPRQCAVGILLGTDTKFKDLLSFRCYGLGISQDLFVDESSTFSNKILEGIKTSEIFYRGTNATHAWEACVDICKTDNDYPKDGAVVKVNNVGQRAILGYTAHHPRWATAVKLREGDYPSKLESVEWSVGVQGTITPTLIITPVNIDGVMVGRATGDNATAFDAAHYRTGDSVWVKRAGDVIPKITKHLEDGEGELLSSPRHCPCCNSATVFRGKYLKCINDYLCSGQTRARLLHFVSRDALNLTGFGAAAIDWAMSQGVASGDTLLAYFRDRSNKETICEHFGELTGVKLMAVCRNKVYPLSKVIFSLALPHVGKVAAKRLAYASGSLFELLDGFSSSVCPSIEGLSDTVCESVYYWLDHPEAASTILGLHSLLETLPEPKIVDNADSDLVVCFTGTGDGFDRGMLEQSAIRAGYKVSKSVTKKLTYLVIGSRGASSSKIDKAVKYKIPVISVSDWMLKTQ